MPQGRRVIIFYCLVPFGFALRVPILYPGKAHTETLSWEQKEGKSHTDGKSILSLKKNGPCVILEKSNSDCEAPTSVSLLPLKYSSSIAFTAHKECNSHKHTGFE